MIRASKSTADKVGGCTACASRGAVKEICISGGVFDLPIQTFRLCAKCEKELNQALRDAR